MKSCFVPADILLPDFNTVDGSRWAVIACDQFTSQPEYWQHVRELTGDAPSAFNLILPEAFLGHEGGMLESISFKMKEYINDGVLCKHALSMIYLERRQSDGRIRRGVVGAVDLECYDWHPGTQTLIRATEGTVPERIPPRVKIRKNATLELPHIMLLIDDPDKTIIEGLAQRSGELTPAYDFELMLGGGHVSAWFVDEKGIESITNGVERLSANDASMTKYGIGGKQPLAIAVGDGNHSLATAKAVYEQLKEEIGPEAAMSHPARYALAELVNIHDDALDFEPIYRVVFNADPASLIADLRAYCDSLNGKAAPQKIEAVYGGQRDNITIKHPVHQLTVGSLQRFLDQYKSIHPEIEIDYIHGEDSVCELAKKPMVTAFVFEGMTKDSLFRSVICDGALPRKTFSMGHAEDKRYYIEARSITK